MPRWKTAVTLHGRVVHVGWFVPIGYPGSGPVVNCLLPECEVQCITELAGIIFTNDEKNPGKAIEFACQKARGVNAAFFLACDNGREVDRWVKATLQHLPGYKRMPVERLLRVEDRADIPMH